MAEFAPRKIESYTREDASRFFNLAVSLVRGGMQVEDGYKRITEYFGDGLNLQVDVLVNRSKRRKSIKPIVLVSFLEQSGEDSGTTKQLETTYCLYKDGLITSDYSIVFLGEEPFVPPSDENNLYGWNKFKNKLRIPELERMAGQISKEEISEVLGTMQNLVYDLYESDEED